MNSPKIVVTYNGKNISEDLQPFALGLTYTDKVKGETDEISLSVEDADGRWRYTWLPVKGDKIEVSLALDGFVLPCGVFTVDEIELTGPPDVVNIKGLAVPITSSLRTKKSYAHENKKISQIAKTVADANGLTVLGTIEPDIVVEKSTQFRESDLAYLKRLGSQFGMIFSVRGETLVFTSIYRLEAGSSVATLTRAELIRYTLKDSTDKIYKAAKVAYHNPDNQTTVSGETTETVDGVGDTLEIRTRADNRGQAEAMTKAALHDANTRQQAGTITVSGNLVLVSGSNFTLTGMGRLSGVYHITGSTHNITPSGGYSTDLEVKKVAAISEDLW